ncbi:MULTISPECIES: HNH endonuclease [Frankia]|uniref:HNH endonuclease n=1 Tax=Frankia TaxID=1854 RepID=UPI0009FD0C70
MTPNLFEHGSADDVNPSVYRPLPRHLQDLVDLLPLNVPVHRSEIEKKYGKSNYARRIRKIASEYGWEIERFRDKSGANDDWYVRRSEGPIRPQRIRYEVAPKRRLEIYDRDHWKCQICEDSVGRDQNLTLPQCDHKVPAERGGISLPENLQTLCTRCNLKKRQACGSCTLLTCENCPFAFPEKYDDVIILRLPREVAEKIRAAAAIEEKTISDIITYLTRRL